MPRSLIRATPVSLAVLAIALVASSCSGRRMLVVTGTSIGLHASPGDGNTSPPQATLGYKRSEVAIVPTGSKDALNDEDPSKRTDAFSALAAFRFYTRWVERTSIESVIATGHAARCILDEHDLDSACDPNPPAPTTGAPPPTSKRGTTMSTNAASTAADSRDESRRKGAGKFADAIRSVIAERDWEPAAGCICGILCPDEPCSDTKKDDAAVSHR